MVTFTQITIQKIVQGQKKRHEIHITFFFLSWHTSFITFIMDDDDLSQTRLKIPLCGH